MTVIDSHAHAEEVGSFGWIDPPEAMLRLMDEAGVDRAVIMTYTDAVDDTPIEYIARAVEQYPHRLVGYARIHPNAARATEILDRAIQERGFKGLKLHPVSSLAHPAGAPTIDLVRRAGELGVPTLFHCGDEPMSTPLELEHTAIEAPDSNIIFGHMGGYFHTEDAIRVALRRPNVYLETSAMPFPAIIRRAIDSVGPGRVLFASDGPGCDPRLELYKVERAALSVGELTQVLSDNVIGLWGA